MARRGVAKAIGPAVAGLVLVVSACGSVDDASEAGSGEADPSPTPSSAPTASDPTPSRSPSPTTSAPSPPPTDEPSTPSDSPTKPPEDPMPETGPVAEAIADLAKASGVSPDDIQVVAHDQVTWRDGSLGCPEPGKMYTQALVDGYRIVLRADGETVHYHGSSGGSPFRCDDPDPNGAVGR